MVYIIVVGMPGSGKDVFVDVAVERGMARVRMGDVVRKYAEEAGLASDDSSIGRFAHAQRVTFGPEIWAVRTMRILGNEDTVIDGSRSLAEIGHFKKELGDRLVVVGIIASVETRFGRLSQRGRPDDPANREMFDARDEREKTWGLTDALDSADIKVENELDFETFKTECARILDGILAGGGKKY